VAETWLTAADPEPPRGSIVDGEVAGRWCRTTEPDTDYWLPVDDDGTADPESWNKIAGNYGPVKVTKLGEEEHRG